MTIREQVSLEAIKRIKKRLAEIDAILTGKPLFEILALRKEAQKLIQDKPENFLIELDKLVDREAKQLALIKKQKNSSKLIDEKVDLALELESLESEMFFINHKKKMRESNQTNH